MNFKEYQQTVRHFKVYSVDKLFKDFDLSLFQLKVLLALAEHSTFKNGCYLTSFSPGKYSLNKEQFEKALLELRDLGLIATVAKRTDRIFLNPYYFSRTSTLLKGFRTMWDNSKDN